MRSLQLVLQLGEVFNFVVIPTVVFDYRTVLVNISNSTSGMAQWIVENFKFEDIVILGKPSGIAERQIKPGRLAQIKNLR